MRIETPPPSWIHLFVRRAASQRAGSWFLSHTLHHLDRAVIWISGGRASLTALLAGLPVVTLSVIGAKSGRPRSVPLIGIPDKENVVIVASNWGRSRHPAWYYSLKANSGVILTYGGLSERYAAHELEGEEREACLNRAIQMYAGYAAYIRRAGRRRIPVFVLSPDRGHRCTATGSAQPH